MTGAGELDRVREDVSKLQGQIMANWTRITKSLREITGELAQASATAGLQAEMLRRLDGDIADLAERVAALAGDEGEEGARGYRPIPSPQWWLLEGDERAEAVSRLQRWVAKVYVPGYGSLARRLPGCWAQHPLCLFELDWLSELWSVLYLQPGRNAGMLAAQAEWQTRLLPAAVDQMAAECTSCGHAAAAPALNGARR